MYFEEITDKEQWSHFVQEHGPRSGAFLQTWEWGDFQQITEGKIVRLGFFEKEQLVAIALLIEKKLPFNQKYFYCPRGPLCFNTSLTEVLLLIKDFLRKEKAIFLRLEPPIINFSVQGLHAVRIVSPADTLLFDLTKSEEILLAQMHPKTRYNIRLAEKKGVKATIDVVDSLEEAWNLFEQTATRGAFRLHARSYYEQMRKSLQKKECRVFFAKAEQGGEILAVNIMIDQGKTRTYLHGASSNQHREMMAPYVLHWELIKDAKKQGLKEYDWWGIAPKGSGEEHPWVGVTRFKKGFGQEQLSYAGTFDFVCENWKYQLYSFFRVILRFLRRFI
ncbi:hypothetical protein A2239_00715 [Candidatus Uhrbacteria bacterium RIFOXYA2_FULL_40_9]|nr:MAG: Methicillin resistance protein [Candidatus Uhrbacteria bacterium GW2011_GWF2_40_263]OGL92649.1 MAG: hypothetical protein A2239_00715 [Candidatus Uhrbacteria bacterium RIFOXYA2_FULL_40_9]OGL96705.1 MAG: hypothetical protein A2332_02595 [Candidatus Uhrbacteria bacterium RIFOXYB2_FULL_41_18]HBK34678.1 hypothetical protein [Candidatus Uhrbacteria bacterium]HCB56086.1 hypothetical protein [Candidatus Uhrbacteria bacterium]